jgi:lipoate-protein ligase A
VARAVERVGGADVGGAHAWRLLDDVGVDRSGAEQMALDLALLDAVADGAPPVLRLSTWRAPTLSLGRFQPGADVDHARCARLGVEVVRRPTGGRALLHGADVTYAAVLPRPAGDAGGVDALYRTLAGALIAGLARLGVEAAVGEGDGPAGPACFAAAQGADLRVGERKLCGSAQVHRRGAVLQHGSVLCRRLAFDETDLLTFPDDDARDAARRTLNVRTATLADLGAPTGARVVAEALVEGFARTLDLQWRSVVRESLVGGRPHTTVDPTAELSTYR